jgi:AAA15 family ATPase/GTPase
MKLQRIELLNFKSINHAVIEDLSAINIFFGPTNSGKTSLLESLFFQFHHQTITDKKRFYEFLHSKANPRDATARINSRWELDEAVPEIDLHPNDSLDAVTEIVFSGNDIHIEDRVLINEKPEGNLEREQAVFEHLRNSVKLSSSRRPGDSKLVYFPSDETNDQRRQRFVNSLQELKIQGTRYQEFLSHLQKLFPHLVYSNDTERDILDFFGSGFLGTAKLFVYLFDARYQLILIDEPEIHFTRVSCGGSSTFCMRRWGR